MVKNFSLPGSCIVFVFDEDSEEFKRFYPSHTDAAISGKIELPNGTLHFKCDYIADESP